MRGTVTLEALRTTQSPGPQLAETRGHGDGHWWPSSECRLSERSKNQQSLLGMCNLVGLSPGVQAHFTDGVTEAEAPQGARERRSGGTLAATPSPDPFPLRVSHICGLVLTVVAPPLHGS